MNKRLFLAGALIAALVQTAALGKMITDRAALIRDGREVILATGFIDPRDFFRGHYVTLRLEISQIDAGTIGFVRTDIDRGDTIWAELVPGDDEFWTVTALHQEIVATDNPLLRGEYRWSSNDNLNLSFPIDRYFAPKLRAQELEQFRRDDKLGVILALAPDGAAAIKGITVDGERIYQEPLY